MEHKIKMRTILVAGARYMGCAVFLAAALLTARLAYAEIQYRHGTPDAIAHAADIDRFAPPARYFERLAELDPDRAALWLDAALDANPRMSSAWIAQGLALERESQRAGQFEHGAEIEKAERDLLEAARVDRQHLPAWTLANFYFRRQSRDRFQDQFWTWAHRAAALTYDDFRPLLALAHAVEPDPRAALEKLGQSNALLRADLDYLATQGRLEDAQKVARLLLARDSALGGLSETPRMLELAERQIRAGNARDALELWNAVAALLHRQQLGLEHGAMLANGNFLQSPSGVAFDWKLPRTEGALVVWQPSRLSFSLSGNQPESCALLEQIVAVARARRYRVYFEYLTAGLPSPTGIVWDLDGDEGSALQPTGTWLAATAVLRTSTSSPDTNGLGKLRLLYRRAPGTVRVQGRLELRHLSMEVL
jgi:tetratricopeptide (TPR) repeat protein